ncbi:hypothetical protein P3388_26075 [Vibrio parahaemolyticus]|nr:hypothetical protein [Vibrio parahaemolyticus]
MADFLPDFDFVEEEFDFAEFDGRPYLFEPEYTDEELRETEEWGRREREAQQVEDERGGMAAARLRSSGDIYMSFSICSLTWMPGLTLLCAPAVSRLTANMLTIIFMSLVT